MIVVIPITAVAMVHDKIVVMMVFVVPASVIMIVVSQGFTGAGNDQNADENNG